MQSLIRFLLVLTALCVAACSSETIVKNVMPSHVEKEMERLLQATVEKDAEALILNADDALKEPIKMRKILDTIVVGTELVGIELYDFKQEMSASLREGKSRDYTISYLIETDVRMFLVIYDIRESAETLILHDISFKPARKKQ